MENSLETRQDFFVVCSGEAEILPLDLKQRRRGEAKLEDVGDVFLENDGETMEKPLEEICKWSNKMRSILEINQSWENSTG